MVWPLAKLRRQINKSVLVGCSRSAAGPRPTLPSFQSVYVSTPLPFLSLIPARPLFLLLIRHSSHFTQSLPRLLHLLSRSAYLPHHSSLPYLDSLSAFLFLSLILFSSFFPSLLSAGTLWNLSSYEPLKMVIINHGLQTMTNEVIIPHSGWEHEPNEDSKPRDAEWTTVFKNTSGCLRSVLRPAKRVLLFWKRP